MTDEIQVPLPANAQNRVIPGNVARVLLAVGAAMVVCTGLTALTYAWEPTGTFVRTVSRVVPYPAVVVGNDVTTIAEYLRERDALEAYFVSAAQESGSAPSEEEIAASIVETIVHKSAVGHLAAEAGVTADAARVEALYAQAAGNADEALFARQLSEMFGWTPEEFRERVVAPVVLAAQLGESVASDAVIQQPRRADAEAALARLAAGEAFSTVAADTSSDLSAAEGGDAGFVNMSDLPPAWAEAVAALAIGEHSGVVDGNESYFIFLLTDRVGAGDTEQARLSVISIPKVTLEEAIQEYLESARVWKFIGRT